MKYQLPLILFDPECPLCTRFKQGLEYLDKSLHFESARNDEVYAEFPELIRQNCLDKVHMLTADKRILSGQEVVDEVGLEDHVAVFGDQPLEHFLPHLAAQADQFGRLAAARV